MLSVVRVDGGMVFRVETLTGERFLDIAAEKVREFVRRHEPERLYVFVSGGKDSAAALTAVAYAGEPVAKRAVIVYNELVGNTARVNVEAVYRLVRSLGFPEPIIVESPPYTRLRAAVESGQPPMALHVRARARHGESFWEAAAKFGIPVRIVSGRRWCYNEFKEKHWRVLPAETRGGRRVVHAVVGIKVADSTRRMSMWRSALSSGWEASFRFRGASIEQHAVSPILGFTEEQVWQLLREAGPTVYYTVRQVYEEYHDSLNCVLCPFRRLEKQRAVAERVAREEWGRRILEEAARALEERVARGGIDVEKARRLLTVIKAALGATATV